ncbi:hypothetical protein C8J57DRAFT_1234570 [Mycena rebaudengoi]|nr:hypothetical protein C8J57DRAFT_1234570 [Mycena rebaudengoi]
MTTSDGLSQLAQNPAYGASNVLEWIKIDKFNDYLIYKSENTVKNATSSAPPDVNVAVASRITPKSVTTLPMRRSRSPSVETFLRDFGNNPPVTRILLKARMWLRTKELKSTFSRLSPSKTDRVLMADRARIFDAEKAASIAAAHEACILVNRHNQDQVRMARNVTRTAKRKSYRQEHGDVGTSTLETQAELAALNASKKDAAARLKELKSQKKELGRVPCHSTASRTGSSTSIPKLVGIRSDDSDDEETQFQVEPDVPSLPAGPLMSSSPFSSPVPMLHPLDETDIEYGSGSYDGSFGVDLPMNDLGGSPLWTITDEVLDAAFAAAAFNSNNPEPMVDAGGFEQQWQAAVNTGFDQESQAILDAVQFSAPADDWPTLPPALPLSPPPESTSSRADSPIPTPVAPEPAPAPRKRQREEVDLRNVLDQPRARKVRKREW